MKESEELKSARTKYLSKLTKYGALPMPATAHYTAGYKDGSNILWAVAQTCAEAERRFEESQADNAALKEQIAQLDAAVTVLEANKLDQQETIAQQAEAIERLTELVLRNEHGWFGLTSYWVINNPEKADAQFLKNAQENQVKRLAIQPNPGILRDRDARIADRICNKLLQLGALGDGDFIEAIRAGDY